MPGRADELGAQHLERDELVELAIARAVDGAHAARAEQPEDLVAAADQFRPTHAGRTASEAPTHQERSDGEPASAAGGIVATAAFLSSRLSGTGGHYHLRRSAGRTEVLLGRGLGGRHRRLVCGGGGRGQPARRRAGMGGVKREADEMVRCRPTMLPSTVGSSFQRM